MQKINKKGVMPDITAKWIEKNNTLNWNDLPFDEKEALREQLHAEQNGLCCYCCKKIPINSASVEHLQDKHQHPKLQFEYENLLLSCTATKHCNQTKQSKSIRIHPLQPDCDNSIKMNPLSAQLVGYENKEDAEESIEILKLNNRELINHRNELLKTIQTYLPLFDVCDDIYQLQEDSTFKDSFLEVVKDFPQYRELEYIINKVS